MSFFLLGKGPDDDLRLLSSLAYPTRKAALAQLSALTSKPDFPHWDADFFVLNLDEGTPILLVRPETAAAETPVATEVPEPEEASAPPAEAEPPAEEPDHDAAIAAVAESLEAEDAVAIEAPEPEPVHAADGVELQPVDEAWAEAIVESLVTEEEEPQDLKKALERTAAHMEADGIVAPDSIGPEPAEGEPPAVDDADAEEAPAAEAPGKEPAVAEPEEAAAAAWPWATAATEPTAAEFVLSALEEPGVDEGSLVRAAGDDETMAASRPVILGSYDTAEVAAEQPSEPVAEQLGEEDAPVALEAETPRRPDFINDLEEIVSEPAPVQDAEVPQAEEPQAAAEPEPAPIAEPEPEPQAAEPEPEPEPQAEEPQAAAEPEPAPIAEPEPAPVAEPAPEASPEPGGYTLGNSATTEMTCNDCVYVFSCPNRDQRQPASCGSFQWK